MKKYSKFIITLLITVVLDAFLLCMLYLEINKITVLDMKVTDITDDHVKVHVNIKSRENKFTCYLINKKETSKFEGKDGNCDINIKTNNDYKIYIKDTKDHKSDKVSINDYLGYILDFQYKNNEIYLIENEEYDLEYKNVLLTDQNIDYVFKSKDNSIATIKNNKIIAKKLGETSIISNATKQELKVIVTNIIHAPVAEGKNKKVIPCGIYNKDQNKLLDEILKFKVNEAGYATRAGAVAAARFLTLEFEYRVPYFYENGRVSDTGVHYADGEGRYYHKGLFLTEEKFDDLKYHWAGPATWGCPLKNFESLPSYGYVPGKLMPNGLDCSGFVTWALYNGGFDPGDVGAGETERPGQCTDLGKFTPISKTIFREGKVRTGDLINFFGHIGMIIGIDLENNQITIAESLPNLGGAIARTYTLEKLVSTFTHVVLMDEYYKEDGNYTIMW